MRATAQSVEAPLGFLSISFGVVLDYSVALYCGEWGGGHGAVTVVLMAYIGIRCFAIFMYCWTLVGRAGCGLDFSATHSPLMSPTPQYKGAISHLHFWKLYCKHTSCLSPSVNIIIADRNLYKTKCVCTNIINVESHIHHHYSDLKENLAHIHTKGSCVFDAWGL